VEAARVGFAVAWSGAMEEMEELVAREAATVEMTAVCRVEVDSVVVVRPVEEAAVAARTVDMTVVLRAEAAGVVLTEAETTAEADRTEVRREEAEKAGAALARAVYTQGVSAEG